MAPRRRVFTPSEADELRRLIREKQTADASRQKRLRERMRDLGFFISDFHDSSEGFTVSDFDGLVTRGTITVVNESS